MSTEGYIFQGQQIQTVEYRIILGPKKRRSFDAQKKWDKKMDHTFWTMHLDGPQHLGQK